MTVQRIVFFGNSTHAVIDGVKVDIVEGRDELSELRKAGWRVVSISAGMAPGGMNGVYALIEKNEAP
jgi:hypothetical protein